jgi:hypothetical protein
MDFEDYHLMACNSTWSVSYAPEVSRELAASTIRTNESKRMIETAGSAETSVYV